MIGGLFLAQGALAHAKLVSAVPTANGTAKAPVRALELDFSEELSPKLSGVTAKSASGAITARTVVNKGNKVLSLMPAAPLKAGVYVVDWHAVSSDDGHRTSGSYRLTVR